MFSDIVEAEGFWRRLSEERGTGAENAQWLNEIELAISQRVTSPTVGPGPWRQTRRLRLS